MPTGELDAHIIVVGGGLAGLTSAVAASERGARVIVLEQGVGERYPCNSRYALGWLHLNYHDVGMQPDALAESLLRGVPDDRDRALIEVIAYNTGRAVRWLKRAGEARFIRIGPAPYEKWVMAPPRPPRPGLVWPGSGPDRVLRRLARRMAEFGSPVRSGHRVSDIRAEGGGFVVEVEREGRAERLRASAVVLADGGFQADRAALARHVTSTPERVLQRNAGTGVGLSLGLAASLGAAVSELGNFYGHLVSRDALERADLWPYPMIDGLANAGIVVGPDGRRFVDEGQTGVYIANRIARRPDPLDATVVVDDATWRSVGRAHKIPPNPLLRTHGGTIHTVGSLAEGAKLAGIDADALAGTVAAFNGALAADGLGALDPVRSVKRGPPREIAAAPFHFIPVCAGVTYTMGGVRIDGNARVVSESGAPIPGLFAAGAAVGGIEGGEWSFYMGGLCRALVLGLISGESAVAATHGAALAVEA